MVEFVHTAFQNMAMPVNIVVMMVMMKTFGGDRCVNLVGGALTPPYCLVTYS